MYAKGKTKGTVSFSIRPATKARKVLLAGSFNGWKPAAMRRLPTGAFSASVRLGPGTHEYKFIVDEQWVVDPDNPTWTVNPFGTFNSVAEVT